MSARMDSLMRAAPTMLLILAITVFGVFEYFRSWKFYQHQEKSFVGFVVNRFTGYYATSINNGALTITPAKNSKFLIRICHCTFCGESDFSCYEHLTGWITTKNSWAIWISTPIQNSIHHQVLPITLSTMASGVRCWGGSLQVTSSELYIDNL